MTQMTRLLLANAAVLAALVLMPGAEAHGSAFDTRMGPIVSEYLRIQDSLASDKTASVRKSAQKIAKLAKKLDPRHVKGKHKKHYANLPKQIATAAAKIAAAKGLEPTREAFKELSRPLAMWASMSETKDVNVVFCSMAKASWLQKGKAIRNPYYGSKMLACGEIVGGKDSPKPKKDAHHDKSHDHHKGHQH